MFGMLDKGVDDEEKAVYCDRPSSQ